MKSFFSVALLVLAAQAQYIWGGDCQRLTDGQCRNVSDCTTCRWSWPQGGHWSDPEADCRCYSSGETDDETGSNFPKLKVEVDGESREFYVVHPSWSRSINTDGDSLDFRQNNRMYLSTVDEVDPEAYFKANLIGGRVQYDVDLSGVGCGCITAVYNSLMPARDSNSDPFKYCDANQVGGSWCPEYDIMEANKWAFRTVGHACEEPDSLGVYPSCDRGGKGYTDVLLDAPFESYGPGAAYTINTELPFTVTQTYHASSDGIFTGYTTEMTQDDRIIVLQTEHEYLNELSSDMTEMVFVFSNWGTDQIDWLQHGVCTGSCDRTATVSAFSNMKIWTSDSDLNPIQPVEPLDEFYYTYRCGKFKDRSLCQDDCDCHMSWPAFDVKKSRSPDAACRCLPKQLAPEGYRYSRSCRRNTYGNCDGCENCKISWPLDDPLKWKSNERMCRCQPESKSLTFSNESCLTLYDGQCGADCHSCVRATDASGLSDCYCAEGAIREVVWGKLEASSSDSGLCGDSCLECRWSWERSDALESLGATAAFRCRNW